MFTPEQEKFLVAFANREIAIANNNTAIEAAKAAEEAKVIARNEFLENLEAVKKLEIEDALKVWDSQN